MEVHFDIQDDKVKGLDIRLTPIESLTLHSALLQFTNNLVNNEVDRITAMRMCDDYIEATDVMIKSMLRKGGEND